MYDFLDEECILCGKEVIQGTQVPFSQQNSLEWEIVWNIYIIYVFNANIFYLNFL